MTPAARLKARLRAREPVLGAFVKTPHPGIVEALALGGLDCICLDGEHAPFDRRDLNVCLLAAHAAGIPAIVRLPSGAPHEVLNALDCGAAGILVPHVRSAAQAAEIAKSAAYGPGGRGFGGPSRGYRGSAIGELLQQAAGSTSVILQIEDIEAVPEADAIAALPGIDALFIGRIDLTVAMGETDPKAPRVMETVADLTRRISAAGRTVGMYTPDFSEVPDWKALGASLFLLGTDHGLLAGAAIQMRAAAGL
jgi:2-keto-3-deoxy-L-rhamnonate aldolase RhmA